MKDRIKIVKVSQYGVTLGTALAVTISWSTNQSILWAILHGFLSWGYVIYYALGFGQGQ